MSEYHCNVEKNSKPDKEQRKVSFNETEKKTELNQVSPNQVSPNQVSSNQVSSNQVSPNETFLDKLFKVKNINFLFLSAGIYILLSNKDFILSFKNIFPFLFNASNEISVLGNGFIGLLFGILLIMYTSFYTADQ
jgi:hypothetical protein